MKTIQNLLLLLMTAMLAMGVSAQKQPQHQSGKHMQGMMGGGMMEHCKEMMQKRDQMQAEMKAMDSKLNELVTKMNKADSRAKTDAAVAVLNEMLAQHKKMNQKMSSMQTGMMQHMMEHMQMGKPSMMMCPMMKEMHSSKGSETKSDDHSKHHE